MLLLIAAALPVQTAAAQEDGTAATVVAVAADDTPVVRAVRGIISYTHWPADPSPIQLCLVGDSPYREQIALGLRHVSGKAVMTRQVAADRRIVRGCHVLYLGGMTGVLASGIVQPGLLTISERDAACRGGGMFCLNIMPGKVSFRLNLDAVARSGLRVDPKVLMLGRGMGKPL